MSFLGKLIGKKDPYDFDDMEAVPGHDPLESEKKVNDYLNSSSDQGFSPEANDGGLPPDSALNDPYGSSAQAQDPLAPSQDNPYAQDSSGTTQSNQQAPADPFAQPVNPTAPADPFAPNKQAQMPNGTTGQQMASGYINKNNTPNSQQPSQTNPQMSKDEVINLKLDSMKNQLDAIGQRILRIEHLISNNNNRKW